MRPPTKHPYYNFSKLASYNAVFNAVVGGRGLGKTYGGKKRAVVKWTKTREQFIYLRRHKGELDSRHTFFTDFENTIPDWDFRVRGMFAEGAPASTRNDSKRVWEVMGYFMALSQAQAKKSMSFTNVTTILFDEFILEEGLIQYLPNESRALLNFYNSVDRSQDKTKVFMFANAVSITNPYFLAWDIQPPEEGESEFVFRQNGFLAVHFPNAEDFAESVLQTRFGQFISDSEYADYAVGNQFADNHDALIAHKNGHARYEYTVETKRGTFSVWYGAKDQLFFIQSRLPKQQVLFCTDPKKMSEHKLFATFRDPQFGYLRRAFVRGKTRFDSPSTRNTFIEVFRR